MRVCTDSRQVQPGDLFVALRGEHFDGHEFVLEAIRRGAVAAMVAREWEQAAAVDCGLVVVTDPRRALGRLAARYRADFSLPVVAVGGANGKTTTKELIAAVLRQQFPTLASEASFNNDIGVPLTLLRLEAAHQAAVVEVGTNHPGELAPLVALVRPRWGVITNIGREHLEFFGDLAGVAAEEGTLAEQLPADGCLVIPGDDPWSDRLAARTRARVVRVGLSANNDWQARDIQVTVTGTTFTVEAPAPEWSGDYQLRLLGRHQVINALFALAVGAGLGLSRETLRRGLAACAPAKMRLELWEAGGVRVLDDSYNANADSMRAALVTLQELGREGRRVAVLGEMAELGAHSRAAHEEVGGVAAECGVDVLLAVGRMAGVMAHAARAAGLKTVLEADDVAAAGEVLEHLVRPGDLVLLKASRAARFERLAARLRGAAKPIGSAGPALRESSAPLGSDLAPSARTEACRA